ncbi:hypothetical protein [Methylobacterium sp. WCS2018Hpa-22]|uniref:hypothetical protein n=1 Tax=Methylobacterium sp. WCS2018Hpa-22 TaxID=3073633 RepID=UPI002889F7D1|nr:hypothetical protein [Methylobacterium sp. WCS2018Hpa-22]
MRITMTSPEGDRACYVYADGDVEMTTFAPYPPQAGELCALFAAAGGSDIAVEPYAPVEPEAVDVISDRQFFQQLAIDGVIDRAEALAAVRTGDIPAKLVVLISDLPADARFNAEMLISGAITFLRSHPLSDVIRNALGWTPQRLADFWRAAAAL